MSELDQQLNNPLHGLKLESLLNEVVSHYGFDILAEYTRLNCFKNNPSLVSSLKFLRKTEWAREKLERFYLYDYKNLPEAGEDEFEIPPRQRIIPANHKIKAPKVLVRGQAPRPIDRAATIETHRRKPSQAKSSDSQARPSKRPVSKTTHSSTESQDSSKPFDPYANAPK